LLLTQVQQLWQFYIAWGLGIGAVMGLTLNEVPFTTIANWFVRMRGRALAIFSTVGGLSTPVLVPLLGVGIATWGWRPTAAAMGVAFGLIMLPAFVIFIRRRPEDLGEQPDGLAVRAPDRSAGGETESPGTPFSVALRAPSFWFVTTAVTLSNLAWGLAGTHMVAYLIGQGYSSVVAAGVLGLVGLVSLPARFVLSVGTERFGGRRVLAVALLAEGTGIALLILAGNRSWLALFILVFGIYYGSVGPLRAATIADEFGRRAFGSIAAAAAFPTYIAIAVGALIAGWIFDVLGSYRSTFGFAAAACVAAALMVIVMPTIRPNSRRAVPSSIL
jgi:MFS family permease